MVFDTFGAEIQLAWRLVKIKQILFRLFVIEVHANTDIFSPNSPQSHCYMIHQV